MARAAVLPPVSPPKRTGRGRPRTRPVAESTTSTKTKLTTAKAKTATATTEPKKRPGRPATKKVELETDEGTDDEIDTIQARQKSTAVKSAGKTSTTSSTGGGRGRKPATPAPVESEGDNDDDELAELEVPKKRAGRPRSKPVAKEESEPFKRGRGRPKLTTTAAKESEKGAGRKKAQAKDTTGSTAKPVFITTNSASVKSNLLRGPAKKKTVTFKDVSGSEEEEEGLPPPPATRRRRGTGVQDGIGAKPARKPASTAGRGRKPAATKKGAKPLSPKKANQVIKAYASSDGEEDELSGAKNQIDLVVNSPTKHGLGNTAPASPVRRVNFTPTKTSKPVDENGEPTLQPARLVDFSDSVYMSSPARRPSASPFQYTMKETPRRGGLNFREGTKSQAQPNLSPIQDSPLKTSPKKTNFGAPSMGISQPSFSPTQSPLKASPRKGSPLKGSLGPSIPQPDFGLSSPLKTSPKRGNLGASFSRSPEKSSSTPFTLRTSLIQSPAKKIPSPFKGSMAPRKSPVAESTEIGAGPERRVSAANSRIASESPLKPWSPQQDGSEKQDEVTDQASPAASESEMQSEAEDEAEPMAEDDAVTMIEETNPPTAQPVDENHQMDHVEDAAEEHAEAEIEHLADQPENHPEHNMEDLVDDGVQENVQKNTEYDTYDCRYLQEEVKDSIEECERQLNSHSEIEQPAEEAKDSETDVDIPNQDGHEEEAKGGIAEDQMRQDHHSEAEKLVQDDIDSDATVDMADQYEDMDHDGAQDFEQEDPQAPRESPPRLSLPYGLEDVFTDTPIRGGFSERDSKRHQSRAPREAAPRLSIPYGLEDVFTDTPKRGGFKDQDSRPNKTRAPREAAPRYSIFEGLKNIFTDTPIRGGFKDEDSKRNQARTPRQAAPRYSIIEGLKDVSTDTPIRGGFTEEAGIRANMESPEESYDNIDETVRQQTEEHDVISEKRDVGVDENTPVPFEGSAAYAVSSQQSSPSNVNQSPERFDENNVEEPADTQVDNQEKNNTEEPVDHQVENQGAESERPGVDEDDGDTHMEFDVGDTYSPGPHAHPPHEASEYDGAAASPIEEESTTPLAAPPVYNIFKDSGMFRDNARYSMASNDDTTSVIDTRRLETATNARNQTPFRERATGNRRSIFGNFTPLANQLSQWKATSPGNPQRSRPRRRGVFSLAGEVKRPSVETYHGSGEVSYPDISKHPMIDTPSLLDEEPLQNDNGRNSMAPEIYHDQEQELETPQEGALEIAELERQPMGEIFSDAEPEMTKVDQEASRDQDAPASAKEDSPVPSAPSVHDEQEIIHEKENTPAGAASPAAFVTPMKNKTNLTHTHHTVSKVPLKPEGEVSPLKMPRKRGRSLSITSPVRSSPRLRKSIFATKDDKPSHSPRKMPKLDDPTKPRLRPSNVGSEVTEQPQEVVSTAASPAKSPRKNITACSQVLQGTVVHVDVHTTEGEDASGIFIELLQQMGARCVKNWAWNPRSSLSPVDGAEPKEGRVGISHVVFKDGGVRTLEKVRQAGGLVKCVGVGWVLE